MCIRFVLLACGVALDVLVHELCEIQPPEFGGDKLVGFKIPGMTDGLMVMIMGKDRVMERVL